MFQRILVAVDATPARHAVVRLAGGLASLTGAEVRVVHVVASAATLAAVVPLEGDDEAKAVLDDAVTALRERGVAAEATLATGLTTQIATTIAEAADLFDADLLVLGPHHRSLVETFFTPRVSDTVAHGSTRAVLLAPEKPAED
ncbi:universal stress protein [Streptomyces phaeofaciens JCM 4814]|uniref:Universal stress protein n=1 Tax=Streptomyces phaeofaciens TaxID=68254 RepID=A0A918H1V7_9ACTN|nr:universal stress protein [Streptomyces phaeofaciens]GGT32023.1 universal stress protein [Streptomyces phaeofaciens]